MSLSLSDLNLCLFSASITQFSKRIFDHLFLASATALADSPHQPLWLHSAAHSHFPLPRPFPFSPPSSESCSSAQAVPTNWMWSPPAETSLHTWVWWKLSWSDSKLCRTAGGSVCDAERELKSALKGGAKCDRCSHHCHCIPLSSKELSKLHIHAIRMDRHCYEYLPLLFGHRRYTELIWLGHFAAEKMTDFQIMSTFSKVKLSSALIHFSLQKGNVIW